MPNLTPELLALGLIWFIVFLFSATCHEAAHALAAKWGGDPTAYYGGQVTLNPVPHAMREPFGMLVVPIASFVLYGGSWMIGWASAPYDPIWAARHPRRAAWMALAGPAANLLLMLLAGIGIRAGVSLGRLRPPETVIFTRIVEAVDPQTWSFAATFLSVFFMMNLVLFAFNLLPAWPLDGHSGITLLMSSRTAQRWLSFISEPTVRIVSILAAWWLFGKAFWPIFGVALKVLYPGLRYT